jgi:arsenite methyltransferase
VADDALTPAQRAERGSYSGCIAGALSFSEYRAGLAAVGLVDVSITSTHSVGDGLHGAIVQATKPLVAPLDLPARPELPRPSALAVVGESGCGCGADGCC